MPIEIRLVDGKIILPDGSELRGGRPFKLTDNQRKVFENDSNRQRMRWRDESYLTDQQVTDENYQNKNQIA